MAPAIPRELERLLAEPALEPYRRAMIDSVRPCWRLEVERVGRLRVGPLGRLLGRRAERPRLPPEASKLGGLPYLDGESWPEDEHGEKLPFVGQINFAELPRLDAPGPSTGIFTLFARAREPFYVWRWHPAPATPTPVIGPSLGRWEARLTATPAVSVSFASWWNEEDVEGPFDALVDWDRRRGGDLGAWTVATVDAPGSRSWYGAEPGDGPWVQLWDQMLEERFGSVTLSVVVRLRDYENGRLDRCAVVAWQ